MGPRLKIDIYLTHFVVQVLDRMLYAPIATFVDDLTSYKFEWNRKYRRLVRVKDKAYCVVYEEDGIFRYPLPILKQLLSLVGYNYKVAFEQIEIHNHIPDDIGDPFNDGVEYDSYKIPRDYQVEYINELTKNKRDVRFVDLQTGRGKGLIAIYSLMKLGKKFAIILLPKYIEKWIRELEELTTLTSFRICVLQGADSFISVMSDPQYYRDNYDVFIFSMRSLMLYIDEFENTRPVGWDLLKYPISPDQLLKSLGVGIVLSDEAHQEFHALYRAMMFLTPEKLIGLSATLDSHDKKMKYLYEMLFPTNSRISNIIGYNKYIDVIAAAYYIKDGKKIPCIKAQGYSHILFEQYCLKNTRLLKQQDEMYLYYAKTYYGKRRKPGQKLLVFCSTVDMCKHLAKVFAKEYPKLKVGTYVQEDAYDELMSSDITVSTIISSGTAVDIPNLITVLQTISIGSLQANIQAMGRLRKLEGTELYYVYTYCKSIPKQWELNNKRESSIGDKAKSYTYVKYNKELSK